MRDPGATIARAGRQGRRAQLVNDGEENASVLRSLLRDGSLSLLYVAPERQARPDAVRLLQEARPRRIAIEQEPIASRNGGMISAPITSGCALRPKPSGRCRSSPSPPDAPTRADIGRLFEAEPRIFLRSFDRPNLHLAMARRGPAEPRSRFLARHKGEGSIIYCASRASVEAGRHPVRAWHLGAALSAGMEPALRSSNQDEFLRADGTR